MVSFLPFKVFAVDVLDSYSSSNVNDEVNMELTGGFTGFGQSFTTPSGISYTLHTAKFYLKYSGSCSGNLVAKLYAHTGTYGSGGLGSGSALAVSSNYDCSTLGSTLGAVILSFDDSYTLSQNTHYVISVEQGSGFSGTVKVGTDSSSPTHGGNAMYYASGWVADSRDGAFEVYGTEVVSTFNLAVTTSGVGTGSVTSSPSGISCSSSCNHDFTSGIDVTLTATPSSGSEFLTWDNSCGATNPCVITMDDDYIVDASFGTTTDSGGGTSTSTASTTIYYNDWLYVNSWIIFFLSLTAFGLIFNLLGKV